MPQFFYTNFLSLSVSAIIVNGVELVGIKIIVEVVDLDWIQKFPYKLKIKKRYLNMKLRVNADIRGRKQIDSIETKI